MYAFKFSIFSGWNPGRRQVPPKQNLNYATGSKSENKTGAKSESETLGAAEQYSLLKADGAEERVLYVREWERELCIEFSH